MICFVIGANNTEVEKTPADVETTGCFARCDIVFNLWDMSGSKIKLGWN